MKTLGNLFLQITGVLIIQTGYAQSEKIPDFDSTIYTEPVFIALIISAILLLILILVLAGILRASLEFRKEYPEKNDEGEKNNGTSAKITTVILLFLLPAFSFAQEAEANKIIPFRDDWYGMNAFTFFTLIGFILFELVVALFFLNQIRLLIGNRKAVTAEKKKVQSIFNRLNASVAIEEEKDILLDHSYDGIRELDNDLPPWWKYGFYLSIVFSFIYLIHYHVTHTGKNQIQEYENEMLQASIRIEEYRKKAANLVDENNAAPLTDVSSLNEGKNTFSTNCAVCHGQSGEGGLGPNLTDNYWLHGGSMKDIFKSVKYGWPENGMKSWQAELSSRQLHTVSSYILSLIGTNPENAKEPQGQLYLAEPSDTISLDSALVTG